MYSDLSVWRECVGNWSNGCYTGMEPQQPAEMVGLVFEKIGPEKNSTYSRILARVAGGLKSDVSMIDGGVFSTYRCIV